MLQEADIGITSLALDGNSNRTLGDETLLVKFFNHPRMNQAKSKEEGRPIFDEVPYIQIMQPGNKDSIIIRPATQMDKDRFSTHFRKFTDREDQEGIEGTLLEEWPGLSRSQVEELKFFNIRTVEQLASVSDTNAQHFMGINVLRKRANDYLEASKVSSAAEELADVNAKYDKLQARFNELVSELEAAKSADADEEKPATSKRSKG